MNPELMALTDDAVCLAVLQSIARERPNDAELLRYVGLAEAAAQNPAAYLDRDAARNPAMLPPRKCIQDRAFRNR